LEHRFMPTMPISVAKATEEVQQPESRSAAKSGTSFWRELITRVAAKAGIDPELALRVADRESGTNPEAINPVSGAVGMMQLMPSTAAALGVDPYNPVENLTGGVQYLRQQISNFGDQAKALAAYNWGPGRVVEAVARWGSDWLSHAPRETQNYVASILAPGGTTPFSSMAAVEPAGADGIPEASPGSTTASSSGPDPKLIAEAASLREALSAYLIASLLE
jgi:soluble lytic murein transglycosylase-like protein